MIEYFAAIVIGVLIGKFIWFLGTKTVALIVGRPGAESRTGTRGGGPLPGVATPRGLESAQVAPTTNVPAVRTFVHSEPHEDCRACREMWGRIEKDEATLAAIRRGMDDIAAGRTVPWSELKRELEERS